MPIGVYVALFGKLINKMIRWSIQKAIELAKTYYDLYGVYQDSNEYFPVA